MGAAAPKACCVGGLGDSETQQTIVPPTDPATSTGKEPINHSHGNYRSSHMICLAAQPTPLGNTR
eukprot:3637812-Amphidinium_carterae.1